MCCYAESVENHDPLHHAGIFFCSVVFFTFLQLQPLQQNITPCYFFFFCVFCFVYEKLQICL